MSTQSLANWDCKDNTSIAEATTSKWEAACRCYGRSHSLQTCPGQIASSILAIQPAKGRWIWTDLSVIRTSLDLSMIRTKISEACVRSGGEAERKLLLVCW